MLLVLAAPIGEDTQTFYNFKNFADFLNVCSANILVLTGLQHQYIGAVQVYWCYEHRSTNILVLLVLAAPIGEDTQTFYNFKNFADF